MRWFDGISTDPSVGVSQPAMIDSKVLLPDPDGPMSAYTRPGSND
jgi:hypothetical protein